MASVAVYVVPQKTELFCDRRGWDYRGSLSVTRQGIRCQPWEDQYPQQHSGMNAIMLLIP